MDNIMKIVKYLVKSDLLIKDVSEKTKNEANEQKCGFFGMLSGTLNVSLVRDIDGVFRADEKVLRAVEETNRAGKHF